jgi:hypothetical protein
MPAVLLRQSSNREAAIYFKSAYLGSHVSGTATISPKTATCTSQVGGNNAL